MQDDPEAGFYCQSYSGRLRRLTHSVLPGLPFAFGEGLYEFPF